MNTYNVDTFFEGNRPSLADGISGLERFLPFRKIRAAQHPNFIQQERWSYEALRILRERTG